MSSGTRQKLGELLLAEGAITPEQLQDALDEQVERGRRLGDLERAPRSLMLTVIRILSQYHHPHVARSHAFERSKKTVKPGVVSMTTRELLS